MERKAIRRGDIFWVEIAPSVGSVIHGRRPAVIVSNDFNNQHANTREVVYLTRNTGKKSMPTHTFVVCGSRVSLALCEQISTVSVSQLGKFIGRCSEKEMYRFLSWVTLSPDAPRQNFIGLTGAWQRRLDCIRERLIWFCPENRRFRTTRQKSNGCKQWRIPTNIYGFRQWTSWSGQPNDHAEKAERNSGFCPAWGQSCNWYS